MNVCIRVREELAKACNLTFCRRRMGSIVVQSAAVTADGEQTSVVSVNLM